MAQVIAFIVEQGNLWVLGSFVVTGVATFVSDSREMESKGYLREARLSRIIGVGLVIFGLLLWGGARVLEMLG